MAEREGRQERKERSETEGCCVYGGPNVYRGMTCPNSTRRTVHGGHFRVGRDDAPDRAVVSGDREFASYNGPSLRKWGPRLQRVSVPPAGGRAGQRRSRGLHRSVHALASRVSLS
jgi:hypothetical protein